MCNLYIMRHGRTEWNKAEKIQGSLNSPLLEESKANLISIANWLLNKQIDIIYSSPLQRCKESAEIVCSVLKKQFVTNNLLIECNHGLCEGLTIEEVKIKFADFFNERSKKKWELPWPNGESYKDVYMRSKFFLNTINREKNILIIAHETFNKTLVGNILHYNNEYIINMKQKNSEIFFINRKNKLNIYNI